MPAFDKTKPMPEWMTREHSNLNTQRGQRYYQKLWQAQPAWADRKRIDEIYRHARAMRRKGRNVHVDHIIPICHPDICGLHVPANLRIMDASANLVKSNHSWPGKGQLALFEPEDFELEFQL